MADSASRRNHHVSRAIAAPEEALQIRGGEASDTGWRAKNWPHHGLLRKRGVVQEVIADVVGTIAGGSNLLQDHLPLAFELRPPERRVLQNVGDEPERHLLVALEHTREIGGGLHAGGGVEFASDRFDLLG